MEPVVIKSGEKEWEIDRQLLDKSDYFTSHLSGRFRLTEIDQKPTFDLGAGWEDSLPNYIYFLKHRRLENRITGDDYALALYLGDQDYLQLCNEAPKISNKLAKMLRHNHKLRRLWPVLDQRDMNRRIYFSELPDEALDLIIEHWPVGASHVDIAQELVVRRGIERLPEIFFPSPGLGVLEKLPYSSVWGFWLLQSLSELEVKLKSKYRYSIVFTQLGRVIERQTQKMIRDPPRADLATLFRLPLDDTWVYQAILYVRHEFSCYLKKIKAVPNSELKLKAACLSVLAKKKPAAPSPSNNSATLTLMGESSSQ